MKHGMHLDAVRRISFPTSLLSDSSSPGRERPCGVPAAEGNFYRFGRMGRTAERGPGGERAEIRASRDQEADEIRANRGGDRRRSGQAGVKERGERSAPVLRPVFPPCFDRFFKYTNRKDGASGMYNRMNVVFIMTDQQRADSIGPNRHPCANYPHMERLRRESVSFDNFYTAASPCVPSRHTFLTGRQPWKLGVSGNAKFSTDGEMTWMQALRDHGYRCVSVGKTHMIHAGSFHIQIPAGQSFGDNADWNHFEPATTEEPEESFFDLHTARRACAALERLQDTEPFALFIGFHAPHEPYVMPENYLDYCRPEDAPLPENRHAGEYAGKSAAYRRRADLFRGKIGEMTDEQVRRGIAGHHCSLKMVDDCLGMILDTLQARGLLDRTLIVYTSDHGELLGEHGLFNKAATAYESEIRIPFMIRFPDGAHRGETVSGFASSLDYAPTLFELLELSPDVSLPGRSLVPAIRRGEEVRDYVTVAFLGGAMGVRTKRHKLWYHPGDKDGELYDLAQDPGELNNLYNDDSASRLRAELFELLLHARMVDDERDNAPTRREKRLREEVRASYEPQVH